MDDIDEPYRVIRPRHQERLAKQVEREASRKRNRRIMSVVLGLIVVAVVVAVIAVAGGGSSPETNLAGGDGAGGKSSVDGSSPKPSDGTSDDSEDEPEEGSVNPPSSVDPTGVTPPGVGSVDGPSDAASESTGTVPPAEVPTTTAPPAPSGPLTGTVVRSCGASGKGDCTIAVRSGPSTAEKAVARMKEGDSDVFVCTVMGEEVKSTALDQPTSVWARNERGNYVSMAYLDIPGWDLFETTHPC